MPNFGRLLCVRIASQFGDGLFGAALAGAILFNPQRAAQPWAIAASFAVLFLPYSLIGPFAGALLDRWDRRYVLVAANAARMLVVAGVGALLAMRADDLTILTGALVATGLSRFVTSGLSAALPHVVPRDQVVTMNSVATAVGAVSAFVGANFMLLPRLVFGADDEGAAAIVFLVEVPVLVTFLLSLRFSAHSLGPDDTARAVHGSVTYAVATGLLHGARTVAAHPQCRGDTERISGTPDGLRDQHPADAGDRPAHRVAGAGRARHRGVVRFCRRCRVVPGDSADSLDRGGGAAGSPRRTSHLPARQ